MLVMHAEECNLLRDEGCVLAVPPHAGFDEDTALKRAASFDAFGTEIISQVHANAGHSATSLTLSALSVPITNFPTFSQDFPCFEWPRRKCVPQFLC